MTLTIDNQSVSQFLELTRYSPTTDRVGNTVYVNPAWIMMVERNGNLYTTLRLMGDVVVYCVETPGAILG